MALPQQHPGANEGRLRSPLGGVCWMPESQFPTKRPEASTVGRLIGALESTSIP